MMGSNHKISSSKLRKGKTLIYRKYVYCCLIRYNLKSERVSTERGHRYTCRDRGEKVQNSGEMCQLLAENASKLSLSPNAGILALPFARTSAPHKKEKNENATVLRA